MTGNKPLDKKDIQNNFQGIAKKSHFRATGRITYVELKPLQSALQGLLAEMDFDIKAAQGMDTGHGDILAVTIKTQKENVEKWMGSILEEEKR